MAGYYYLLKGERSPVETGPEAYRKALQNLLHCISIDEIGRAKFRSGSIPNPFLAEGDSQAYLLLSVVYLRLGDPSNAYEAISKARALDPLNPQIYLQLSDIFARQQRGAEADVAAMQASAITSLQQGNWQQAANFSERVLRSDSAGYPSAYYLNAMANLRAGKLADAEKSAREAIRIDRGHNPRTYYVLGLILAQKQDFPQSAELLHEYLKAAPNAPDSEIVRKQLAEIEASGRGRSQAAP